MDDEYKLLRRRHVLDQEIKYHLRSYINRYNRKKGLCKLRKNGLTEKEF